MVEGLTMDNSAFGSELREFFKLLPQQARFEFLDQLRNSFEAEKNLHPDSDLPKTDYSPRPREIV
jgi:hypothetical protein